MSWKSLVCVALLCVVASSAGAVGPTLDMALRDDGDPLDPLVVLNAAGNWEWIVSVTPDGSSSVATEVAFAALYGGMTSITNTNAVVWDDTNPGNAPTDGNFDFWASGDEGVEQGTGDEVDYAFVGLGSDILTDAVPSEMVTIETSYPYYAGPGDYSLTTRIQAYGSYEGDTKGRLAQGITNYDTVSGTWQYYVRPGDANFDGSVGFGDEDIWKNAPVPLRWYGADFNHDNSVGFTDYSIWQAAPNPGPPAGSGALVIGAVPEPSSLVLALVLGLILAAVRPGRTR